MNRSQAITAATKELTTGPPTPARVAARSEWVWIGLIGSLLVAAGLVRHIREWQFQSLAEKYEASPFPLKGFPQQLGQWKKADNSKDAILEPDIANIAGAKDHLIRVYQNEGGQEAIVLLIYGLAADVFAHTPDVCYPATGFKYRSASSRVEVSRAGNDGNASFLKETFVKYKPGEMRDLREVYHSFRNNGKWDIDMSSKYKTFRYNPGMYKVQVELRSASDTGSSKEAAVIDLLTAIVHEIDEYATGTK